MAEETSMEGCIDEMRLLHECAREFHAASNAVELDAAWKRLVTPAYDRLEPEALGLIERLYSLHLRCLRMAA